MDGIAPRPTQARTAEHEALPHSLARHPRSARSQSPPPPRDLQRQLEQHIQVFIPEKPFMGCAGHEITDEMRVTIAAQACLVILNRKSDYPISTSPALSRRRGKPSVPNTRLESGISKAFIMTAYRPWFPADRGDARNK
jgi:hypothetical protein